jgi:small conductance mechanosensitive channel
VLRHECEHALETPALGELLLDAPTLMGVESIQVDTVTLRMVARTLPGKQFEAGRQLRVLVIRALARTGIVTAADAKVGIVDGPGVEVAEAEREEYEKSRDRVQR